MRSIQLVFPTWNITKIYVVQIFTNHEEVGAIMTHIESVIHVIKHIQCLFSVRGIDSHNDTKYYELPYIYKEMCRTEL